MAEVKPVPRRAPSEVLLYGHRLCWSLPAIMFLLAVFQKPVTETADPST
jgi:hypothetical protein